MNAQEEESDPREAPASPVVRTSLIADVRGYTAFTNERGVPAALEMLSTPGGAERPDEA